MSIWLYDKTFEGFLTLVFDCYDRRTFPDTVLGKMNHQTGIFPADYEVITEELKAKRVWNGLLKKIKNQGCQMLYRVFLSEMDDVEILLLHYIRKVYQSQAEEQFNFGNKFVLDIYKIDKKVSREAERIRMFVRFQRTADDIYYASFDPKYNVLPLTVKHFEKRFSDQKWIIYDTRRNYGFYYDLKNTQEIEFSESLVNPLTGSIDKSIMDKDEKLFQELWKNYFKSICIKERINPRLHRQLLPKRFWKYLIEKQEKDA